MGCNMYIGIFIYLNIFAIESYRNLATLESNN